MKTLLKYISLFLVFFLSFQCAGIILAKSSDMQNQKQQAIEAAKQSFEVEKQRIIQKMNNGELSKPAAKAQIEEAKNRIIEGAKQELQKQQYSQSNANRKVKEALMQKLKSVFDKVNSLPNGKRKHQYDTLIQSVQNRILQTETSEKDRAILKILLEILREQKKN